LAPDESEEQLSRQVLENEPFHEISMLLIMSKIDAGVLLGIA
jgi:hypothetical protein